MKRFLALSTCALALGTLSVAKGEPNAETFEAKYDLLSGSKL